MHARDSFASCHGFDDHLERKYILFFEELPRARSSRKRKLKN